MPAHSKIVDEEEALRWYWEGVSYSEFVERYLDLYGVQTTESMWSSWRRRKRLPRRAVRDDELIPWAVERRHRYATELALLRLEAQRRAGKRLPEAREQYVRNWLLRLAEEDVVVTYDPHTPDGFYYVPRLPEDQDIVRQPPAEYRTRRANGDI